MGATRLVDGAAVRSIQCGRRCSFGGPLAEHHDQLLTIETDLPALAEFMELAITWGELDYSNADVITPALWDEFRREHSWRDPATVRRIFDLAIDVALRSQVRGAAATEQAAARPRHGMVG